jgi:adenylate kinase
MFRFGTRNVIKQGGSFMIALPMQWLKSIDPEMKTVLIEMDSENNLRIVAGDTRQDTTGFDDTHGCEYQ